MRFQKTDDVRCENCVFWERRTEAMPGDEGLAELRPGWCKRFPPVLFDDGYELTPEYPSHFIHPSRNTDDWCGEFQKNTTAEESQ